MLLLLLLSIMVKSELRLVQTIAWSRHKLGSFGAVKLATLILALQFLLMQRLFQHCVCLLWYNKVRKSSAFAEFSSPDEPSYW